MKKVAIGNDHAGFELKKEIVKHLKSNGYQVKDFGASSTEKVDYPDFAHLVSNAIEGGEFDFGILICGSANGISMAANKHQGIRSAVCWSREIAGLARLHNDANVMALPGRFIDPNEARACVDVFLTTDFEGGRHSQRVDKIRC